MILRGVITWQISFWELFSQQVKKICAILRKICVFHTKIWKFLNSKFFRKNDIFVFSDRKYITFVWTKKNFFFDPKKFFYPHDNLCHSTQNLSLNWVILQKNFMSWLGLIFDFKGGYGMTKLILRTFFTQTRKIFEKSCVIHTKFTQNFENF